MSLYNIFFLNDHVICITVIQSLEFQLCHNNNNEKNHILRLEGVCTEIQDFFFFLTMMEKFLPSFPSSVGTFPRLNQISDSNKQSNMN